MLIMPMVVRDEANIIADTLRHHLDQGIDRILVADNGSTDGTLDILHSDAFRGAVEVFDKGDGLYLQKTWTNEMIRHAIERYKVDWVVPNDADEFYHPNKGQTLKSYLGAFSRVAHVYQCSRLNIVGDWERLEKTPWKDVLTYRSRVTQRPPKQIAAPDTPLAYPFFMFQLPPKVVFRAKYFEDLSKGAHKVTLTRRNRISAAKIEIRHYPVRSVSRFMAGVERIAEVARQPEEKGTSSKYLRWATMLEAGCDRQRIMNEVLPNGAACSRFEAEGLLQRLDGFDPQLPHA